MTSKGSIEVFSTCPYSSAVERERFLPYVMDVARWSEQAGCRGILVYTDNSTVDPWLVSQIIIQSTEALCPLVAGQPFFFPPYFVAQMVAPLGHFYGPRLLLYIVCRGV